MEATQETKRRRHGEIREDGMVFWCYQKGCKNGEWWVSPEKAAFLREKQILRQKKAYQKSSDKYKKKSKDYRVRQKRISPEKFKEKERLRQSKWRKQNLEKAREYARQWLLKECNKNPMFRARRLMRTRTFSVAKKFSKGHCFGSSNWLGPADLVGDHLQAQFLPGMNWQNMGKHGWHIDHIIPLACAKSLKHLEALCHYLNLQPLWSKENLSKGDKIPEIVPDNIKHLLPENWNE